MTENKIAIWMDAKAKLDKYKALEIRLRNEIVSDFAKVHKKGTHKFTKGNYKITIGMGTSMKLDETILDTIKPNLSDLELNCITYKPALVAKELKLLEGNEKIYLAITESPSQSTLKIAIDE